jgi:CBS domain-containing protein
MLVQQILASKGDLGVITVAPGATVQEVAALLSSKRIGAVIVRELGKRGSACLSDKVESLMTAKIVSCTRAEGTDAVLGRMTDGRFRHMPVIEDGQMVGLISIGDVVKARLMELAAEKDALEGMIKGF